MFSGSGPCSSRPTPPRAKLAVYAFPHGCQAARIRRRSSACYILPVMDRSDRDPAIPPQFQPSASRVADPGEVMRTCPVCSKALAERKCKLYCPDPVCGYYLSCSDFY